MNHLGCRVELVGCILSLQNYIHSSTCSFHCIRHCVKHSRWRVPIGRHLRLHCCCRIRNLFPTPRLVGLSQSIFSLEARVLNLILAGVVSSKPIMTYTFNDGHPFRAEQSPDEWWSALQSAVVEALAKAEAAGVVVAEDVKGLCVDTTSCTVVALDKGTVM